MKNMNMGHHNVTRAKTLQTSPSQGQCISNLPRTQNSCIKELIKKGKYILLCTRIESIYVQRTHIYKLSLKVVLILDVRK